MSTGFFAGNLLTFMLEYLSGNLNQSDRDPNSAGNEAGRLRIQQDNCDFSVQLAINPTPFACIYPLLSYSLSGACCLDLPTRHAEQAIGCFQYKFLPALQSIGRKMGFGGNPLPLSPC